MKRPPLQLEHLDAWLEEREGQYDDLRPDAHARIVWQGGERRRRSFAIVYLHGFSASPMETSPVCERLAGPLHANVYYPRLTGHGRGPEALSEGNAKTWIEDAREAMAIGRRIGEWVILVGTSTGGTLATLLAASGRVPELAALILIAPNFGLVDRRSALLGLPAASRWIHWLVGRERVIEAENEAHARYWTLRYATHTLVAMYALVRKVRRVAMEGIDVPVLAIFSDADQVVDASRTRSMLARVKDAECMVVPDGGSGSQHVVVGDAFGAENTDAVVARSLEFLTARGINPV